MILHAIKTFVKIEKKMTFSNTADRRLENKKKLSGLWGYFRIGLTIATFFENFSFLCTLFNFLTDLHGL